MLPAAFSKNKGWIWWHSSFQGQKSKAELTDRQNSNAWMRVLGEWIDTEGYICLWITSQSERFRDDF